MHRLLALLLLGLVVWAAPVAAQKPTPPPTPAPVVEAPVEEPTKAPEPPTPTPEPLPTATPEALPPTATTVWPTATATAVATLEVPTVTATLPRPTMTQATSPTVVATATLSSIPTVDTATPAQWLTLPGWVWPVAGGIGLLILWLIVRFVGYTRQDLAMKRRMIAEDTAARVAAHRRDVAAQLQETDAWQHLLGQIATDTLNAPVRIAGDTLPHIDADALAFTALDDQGVRYCFTVASPRKARPQGQVYRLDDPETQTEVSTVWHYLAAQRLQGTLPAVPRQATWVLVMQRPLTPQVKRRANWRWWLGVALGVLLLIAASTLVGARLVQAHLATPTPVVAAVALVNDTGETVSLWTVEEDPLCIVCPEAALLPEESRVLDVTPGPLLWEIVRVPFGDFYTAYRLGLVETYVSPGATARDTVITLTKMPFTNGR